MPAERGFQLCDFDRSGDSAMISSCVPSIDASHDVATDKFSFENNTVERRVYSKVNILFQ